MNKENLLVVCGPTATGKSKLAIKIAEKYNGVIVSMDSMQIYKYMNIGTAKPTNQEKMNIVHEMIDIVDPKNSYSVADYVEAAEHIITEINQSNKIPILVGGTGLYLKALINEYSLGNSSSNEELRSELYEISKENNGKDKLHRLLTEIDPKAAEKLHFNDIRRVIRAIEVIKTTGKSISNQNNVIKDKYNTLIIGLNEDRNTLYKNIEYRVDQMFNLGLVDEVKWLLNYGVNQDAQSLKGIGYKEILPYLNNLYDLETAIYKIKLNTRHYAKRQITYFKSTNGLEWINKVEIGDYWYIANKLIQKWMEFK